MIGENRKRLGARALCEALGEPRSSWYRSSKPAAPTPSPRRSFRALSAQEEKAVLDVLNSERFCDTAPAEIHATLLDEGRYLCAERTMYRILRRNAQALQRRQSAPRNAPRPELLASAPNQLWSWDITKLKGPTTWTYYYLYKILDVFSRYIVGWMVAYRESADLAKTLIAQTCRKQGIEPGQLTLHADRGSAMTSKTVGELLLDMGVAKTHSRPHVSNDNPYSESAFKTLKYRPGFPNRFGSIQDARAFGHDFFPWYNGQHRHSGIAMLTPQDVHYGSWPQTLRQRSNTLRAAYSTRPQRFVKGLPQVKSLPANVWINNPTLQQKEALAVS